MMDDGDALSLAESRGEKRNAKASLRRKAIGRFVAMSSENSRYSSGFSAFSIESAVRRDVVLANMWSP